MQLGFPQVLSFLSGHDFIVEDERALTSLDPEVTTDALYYVPAADQMLTRLIKIAPEDNFDAVQAKGACAAGIVLRLKIKTIARGLKKMGISETFNIGDVLRPDSKVIRYLFSRIIYFHDYLFAFKQQVAPALKNLVLSAHQDQLNGAIATSSASLLKLSQDLARTRQQLDQEADEVRLVLHQKADTLQRLEQESGAWRELEAELKKLRETRAELLDRSREATRREEDLRKLIDALEGKIVKDPQRIM